MHFVDIYWLVMPTLTPRASRSTGRTSPPSWASGCWRSPSASGACAGATRCRSRIPTSPTPCGTGSHEHAHHSHAETTRRAAASRGRRSTTARSSLVGVVSLVDLRASAPRGRRSILQQRDRREATSDGRAHAFRPSSAAPRSASSTRSRSTPTSACTTGAPSAPRELNATAGSIAGQGHRPHPDRARDGPGRGGALPRGSAQVKRARRASLALAALRASLLGARRRARREARRSSSRRAASSRWRRCRTSTSSSTWATASRRAWRSRDPARQARARSTSAAPRASRCW